MATSWIFGLLWIVTASSLAAAPPPRTLPVKMRGISTSADLLTADLFRLLAETDANTIRVGINVDSGLDYQPTASNPLAPYSRNLATLDSALPLAEDRNIKIILAAGETFDRKSERFWQKTHSAETARTHLILFWEAVAKRYKGNPVIVGFDILNEPNYPAENRDVWLRDLLPRTVKAIREVDKSIWIIAQPGPWGLPSGFAYMPLLMDSNVIYSFHHYAPHSYTHQGLSNYPKPAIYPGQNSMWGDVPLVEWEKTTLRKSMQPAIDFARQHNVRILVGEFGSIRWASGSHKWLSDSIEIFEEHGWDWCFHSIGGWNGWSPTYKSEGSLRDPSIKLSAADGGDRGLRWQVLTRGWSLNRRSQNDRSR